MVLPSSDVFLSSIDDIFTSIKIDFSSTLSQLLFHFSSKTELSAYPWFGNEKRERRN
jgi:hypothetical protein